MLVLPDAMTHFAAQAEYEHNSSMAYSHSCKLASLTNSLCVLCDYHRAPSAALPGLVLTHSVHATTSWPKMLRV